MKSHQSDPKFKAVTPVISEILEVFRNTLNTTDLSGEDGQEFLLTLLEKLDTIEEGNFDAILGYKSNNLTQFLIKKLEDKSFEKFFATVIHFFLNNFCLF